MINFYSEILFANIVRWCYIVTVTFIFEETGIAGENHIVRLKHHRFYVTTGMLLRRV
jgi:hypothetical protein